MAKALALFSGGLDSILAVRLMLEQNVPVVAMHFVNGFGRSCSDGSAPPAVREAAQQLGVPLEVIDISGAFLELVKLPPHGYGSQMNPCIDCRIQELRLARQNMARFGADFVVTGEVVGQRPMSQRHFTLSLIEREAGVQGLVVRPLCARLLPPSQPEQRGWVDRARLLDISGRSRKTQMALARQFGITVYPTPAGGCLLTDPGFSARLRDLFAHKADADLNDVNLLKLGRHFRLSDRCKVVVGRDQDENPRLAALARRGDHLFELAFAPGPVGLLRGAACPDGVQAAANILVRYSKLRSEPEVKVFVWLAGSSERQVLCARAPDAETIERLSVHTAAPSSSHPAE